jgi:GH35 family endo-1,4-beta-xylanase
MNIKLLVAATLVAATLQAAPSSTPLLPDGAEALAPAGETVECGVFTVVPVEGQDFADAVRVETIKTAPFPYNVRVQAATTGPIKKGDTLSAEFTARRIKSRQETGEALIAVIVEGSAKPHTKSLERDLSVGPEWTRIRIPFRADRDAAAGEMQLSLRAGYPPQTLEIGGVKLLNYGPDVEPQDLPQTDFSYEGHEPDAPWRQEAAERIDRIRKADLRIAVTDNEGRPVPGAKVAVRMQRHEFGFGTAIRSDWIVGGDSPDHERYRETLKKYFNKAVFEDDIKWHNWIDRSPNGKKRREHVLAALDWLEDQDITPRGHVMVWPSWPRVPDFLRDLGDDRPKLRQAILDHIADQTSVLGRRLAEWDVINESYAHNDVMNVLGRGAMVEWFQAAHKGAPDVKLFYNDYVMFDGEGPGSPSQYFYDTIKYFQENGAPIGGIGEQGHFGGSPPPPTRVLKVLDRFGELGLPIQITEFDIDTSDLATQVAYTRDFLTAVFSHPAVSGVMCWGFWEGRHWKSRAAFWSKDWQLRPNGEVWVELTTKKWWTNVDLETTGDGTAGVRGFRGDYEVTVTSPDGKSATKDVTLAEDGAKLGFKL